MADNLNTRIADLLVELAHALEDNRLPVGSRIEFVKRELAQAAKELLTTGEPEWVAQVVSSGPFNFPLLQWRSADVSFLTPIGTKLVAASATPEARPDARGERK